MSLRKVTVNAIAKDLHHAEAVTVPSIIHSLKNFSRFNLPIGKLNLEKFLREQIIDGTVRFYQPIMKNNLLTLDASNKKKR